MPLFLLTFGLIALVASLPVSAIVSWLFKPRKFQPRTAEELHLSSTPLLFFFSQFLTCLLPFLLLTAAQSVFYYEDDLFFLLSVLLITAATFWSPFFQQKRSDYLLPFFCGFFAFFYSGFIWIIPLLFLLTTIATNTIRFGYFFTLFILFLAPTFVDVHPLFTVSNTSVIALYFLRFNSELLSVFGGSPATLLHQFNHRLR